MAKRTGKSASNNKRYVENHPESCVFRAPKKEKSDQSSSRVNNIKRILKLNNLEQIKEINKIFYKSLRESSVRNAPKALYENYEKVKELKKVFVDASVSKWNKISGNNYTKNIGILPQFLDKNNKLRKNQVAKILQTLDLELDETLKLESNYSFAFDSNKIYKELVSCEKEILGVMFTNAHMKEYEENRMAITMVLQGNISSKLQNPSEPETIVPVAFAVNMIVAENNPERAFGLYMLVNGMPQGVKPLERIDNLGLVPNHILDKLNIEPVARGITLEKYNSKIKHYNLNNKDFKDEMVEQKLTSRTNQIHFATAMNDEVYCALTYLKQSLGLYGKVKQSAMPAKDVDIYKLPNKQLTKIYYEMKTDAQENGGYTPVHRLYDFAEHRYNIKNRIFNQNFFKEIDGGSSVLTQFRLPEIDRMLHEHLKDCSLLQNVDNIVHVVSKNMLRTPTIDPNYRYAYPIDYRIQKMYDKIAARESQKEIEKKSDGSSVLRYLEKQAIKESDPNKKQEIEKQIINHKKKKDSSNKKGKPKVKAKNKRKLQKQKFNEQQRQNNYELQQKQSRYDQEHGEGMSLNRNKTSK